MPRRTKDTLKNEKQNKLKKTNKLKKEQNIAEGKNEKFSFDEEIVIGLRRIDEPKIKNRSTRQRTNERVKKKKRKDEKHKQKIKANLKRQVEKKQSVIMNKQLEDYEEVNINLKNNINKNRKTNEKNKKLIKRKKRILKIVKFITLIGIIIGGTIYAMLSPIFNISEITVVGNRKISSDTIISLSNLSINQNIFKFSTSSTIQMIKENSYIDKVEIKRNLPNKVEIKVYEREPTFMLIYGNAYVYINNQGYFLETTNKKENYPIIDGYKTPMEQIQDGKRLSDEDLERLEDVLKIIESAKSVENNLKDKITKINISDKSNYIITMEKEKKKIYLGDTTNMSTKMLWINEFLNSEKENEGIIYLNVDLNNEEPYFREKV